MIFFCVMRKIPACLWRLELQQCEVCYIWCHIVKQLRERSVWESSLNRELHMYCDNRTNIDCALTDSLLLGATVRSRIGSHSSLVWKIFVRGFSSNDLASRKNVTEPMLRCDSLVVSLWVLGFSFSSFLLSLTDGTILSVVRIFGVELRIMRLPWRLNVL